MTASFAAKAFWYFQFRRREWTDNITFLLQRCANPNSLQTGKIIHAQIIKCGFSAHVSFNNKLCTMYAKCGRADYARQVFDKMPARDVVSWNSMIAGYSQQGIAKDLLNVFQRMQMSGVCPDEFTVCSLLQVNSQNSSLEQVLQVHAWTVKLGLVMHPFVCCSFVDVYAKSSRILEARNVFDEMPRKDRALLNSMISGYAFNGLFRKALKMFYETLLAGFKPDAYTFAILLGLCGEIGDLKEGRKIHGSVIKSGFDTHTVDCNALISMYSKSGNLEYAWQVFDEMPELNVVSWNALISGCVGNESFAAEAIWLFIKMQRSGTRPNQLTFAGLLSASTDLGFRHEGIQVHAFLIKLGFDQDVIVGSILIDMYSEFMKMDEARLLFDNMPNKTLVTWTTMISSYVQHRRAEEAIKLFYKLRRLGLTPNQFTLCSVFIACAGLALLKGGKQVHALAFKSGFRGLTPVENCVIDMYAKCGSIEDSQRVFDGMIERDRVSWSSMISAYSQHGFGRKAVKLFDEMINTGIRPDHITFVSVLSACSHAGLLEEGRRYFRSMSSEYSVIPRVEHYNCMVDLLSRAGLVEEAFNFINEMPMKPGVSAWGSLLRACRIHGNTELATHAAECLFKLEPHRSGAYVQLANVYAAAGRWEDKARITKMMKDNSVKKEVGKSWIEINNEIHAFCREDRSHPQSQEIYAKLEELGHLMRKEGYTSAHNDPCAV